MIKKIWSFIKKHKWTIIVCIALLIVSSITLKRCSVWKKESSDRETVILAQQEAFKTLNNKWGMHSSEQRVRIGELEEMALMRQETIGKLLYELKKAGIKIKNLESAGISVLNIIDTFYVQPDYDTTDLGIYKIDRYNDPYLSFERFEDLSESLVRYTYMYQDTLVWGVSKHFMEPWKFKHIFKWRTKYYRLTASYSNPKAKIVYQEYFKITGRKKR